MQNIKHLNTETIAFKMILLFPLIFMIYNIVVRSVSMRVFYFIFAVILCLLFIVKNNKITKSSAILLTLCFLKLFYDYFAYPQSIGDALSFAFLILFLYIYSDESLIHRYGDFLLKESKTVSIVFALYICGIIYTILFANGYVSYWGTTSLFGYYGVAHFLAYELLVLFAISFYLFSKEKKALWIIYMFIFGVMMILTTVRTVVLSVLISVVYLFVIRKGYKKWAFAVLGLVALYFVFQYTDLLSSIIAKTQNAASLGSATSGREFIWKSSFNFFLEGGIREKMFGSGIQSLMNWNLERVNMEIQAHNDFLTVLSAFGVFSLVTYLFMFIRFCKCKGGLGVFFTIMVLIFFNGLYSYYSFVIGLPIIKLVYETINDKQRSEYNDQLLETKSLSIRESNPDM